MKRYILPIALTVAGAFLFFYGVYQVRAYNNQPWTHFTGACSTYETPTGCPQEAAETNERLSSTPEARANQFWQISALVGVVMAPTGLVLGMYRFVRAKRHKGIATAKVKS